MAVNSDSCVGGGLCRVRLDNGHGKVICLLQPRLWQEVSGICIRLDAGASVWHLILLTDGVKAPDLTDEQGEIEPLGDWSIRSADQPVSCSQPSDRMDSLEEKGDVKSSTELTGLRTSSSL